MKIIFAQGNPGADYALTRHNVGWLVLDAVAHEQGGRFQPKPKFLADIAEVTMAGQKTLLVKPQTFYNETGQSARLILDFYKLTPADLLVIHDELALPLGTIRVREKGSDAGNNGIKSLSRHLGEHYARLRLGIQPGEPNLQTAADFVLGRFTKDEQALLARTVIPKAISLVDDFCQERLRVTSHTADL